MDYSTAGKTLSQFRNNLYACFGTGRDALMNICDALLTETQARSLPELSLSPLFVRRWPSLYEAFDDGSLDRQALLRLFVSLVSPSADLVSPSADLVSPSADLVSPSAGTNGTGKRLVLAVDASPVVRGASPTARDRTYVHVPNLPDGVKPVAPGWQFSTVVAVPEQPSSWTTILDNRRIPSHQTPGQTAADQIRELLPLLPPGTVFLLDGGYGNPTFLSLLHSLLQDQQDEQQDQQQDKQFGFLLRTAKNRTLYRLAPPRTGKRGAPKKDGNPFRLGDPATHGVPDQEWTGTDDQGRACRVSCWHRLHFKKCREAPVSLLRVCYPGVVETKREPGTLWLLWYGTEKESPANDQKEPPTNCPMPALSEMPSLYRRRFNIEHGYRFDKQCLLWEKPRLRTPEKFETWTQVVSAVHNLITLAHSLTLGQRHPWESRRREATPQQVRRACGSILYQFLGSWGHRRLYPKCAENRRDALVGPKSRRRPGTRQSLSRPTPRNL